MCTKKELQFSIFLIYNLAEKWQKQPADVYKTLNETNILDNYIFVCYDTLHTLGTEYLVEDITSMQGKRVLLYDSISWYD